MSRSGGRGVPVKRNHPLRDVWATIAVLLVISATLLTAAFGATGLAFSVPSMLGLVVAFALGERVAFHLPARRGAHTLTVVELAAVVGVALTAPLTYVTGRMLGSLFALVVLRRQRGVRLAFNIANTLLGAAIGAMAISAFGLLELPMTEAWPVVLGAVSLEAFALGLPVAFVIRSTDPERPMSEVLRELSVSWVASLSVAAFGIVLLVLAMEIPGLAVVVVGLGIAGILGIRSYSELYLSQQELDGVSTLTSQTATAEGIDDLARAVLASSADLLRSERGVLVIPVEAESVMLVRSVNDHVSAPDTVMPSGAITGLLDATDALHVVQPGDPAAVVLFGEDNNAPVALAPLIVADRTLGLLALTEPAAPSETYSPSELRLFETLAWHSATAISRVLLEERLRAENEVKASIIRSKDQLIAAVSHELRTPLTGILGFAEMLRDGAMLSTEMSQEITSTIADEALDLSFIVEDLLTAARHELGALSYHCKPHDLARAVERALPSVERRSNQTFWKALGEVAVMCDGPRVRQIVRNLAANAVRYGGADVQVTVAEDGDVGAITVRDNGTGVPGKDSEQVFEPYRSAHEPGTQAGSIGLGLTISREMARAMGGDLTYRRVNGWTEFTLSLPLVGVTETSTLETTAH